MYNYKLYEDSKKQESKFGLPKPVPSHATNISESYGQFELKKEFGDPNNFKFRFQELKSEIKEEVPSKKFKLKKY